MADDATTTVSVRRHRGGADALEEGEESVAVEEPLEIRVEGEPTAVTMRTPGDDLDLAVGFLRTEGVIDGRDDLRAVAIVGENRVDVRLAEGVPRERARSADRALYATSSCGICGKASVDRIVRSARRVSAWEPPRELLLALPERLRAGQAAFHGTGGLHAAALFDADGVLHDLREDVGRHNAVDKVIGARVRADREDLDHLGIVVSSRAGFEIVQKAIVAGIPVVVCLGAATSLAVEAASAGGVLLVTWARADRYVVHPPGAPLGA